MFYSEVGKRIISYEKTLKKNIMLKNYIRYGSKYNAVPKRFKGRLYHSTKEADVAVMLDLQKKAGDIKDYTPQFTLRLNVNGVHICNIIVDFLVIEKYGAEKLLECKGFRQPIWSLKWKLLKALYGKQYKYEVI